MPFIGLDWRSPGESWIKTPTGSWERLKVLENSPSGKDELSFFTIHSSQLSSSPPVQLSSSLPTPSLMRHAFRQRSCLSESEKTTEKENIQCLSTIDPETKAENSVYQPFCHIFNKPTRERRNHVSLSEAFWKLDFPGGAKDVRRFNYVCKVLDVLISEKLTTLGGAAQKLLFSTLDHVFGQVLSTQQNMHISRLLMQDLNEALEDSNMLWGKHMGSSIIWKQHRQRLQQWNHVMHDLEIHQREEDGKVMLTDLPEECVRLILLCLSSHHDLLRSEDALKANPSTSSKFGQIFNEQRLWRELCFFHFKPQQLKEIIGKSSNCADAALNSKEDWEKIYHKMKRYFGLKETYAETLHLCLHCRTLFWKPYGHPCPVLFSAEDGSQRQVTNKPPIPISPRAFLDFFSL